MPVSDVEVLEEFVQCEKCGGILETGRWPMCPHDPTSAYQPFKAYTVKHEGITYTIDSIQAADKLERETMQRYRNGEGAPAVLRMFHQDHSNLDRNTLGSLGYRQRSIKELKHDQRGNPRKTRRGFTPDE